MLEGVRLYFPIISLLVYSNGLVVCDSRVRRPNIVFLQADDLGYNDIGYQNPQVLSPNIDKLASEGVILTSSYVPSACSPSRAAFLTGLTPYKTHMHHRVIQNPHPHCLPTNATLLPQYLKQAGYTTHLLGKWHQGFCSRACVPTERGFDTFYGYYTGIGDHVTHTFMGGYDWRDGERVAEEAGGTHKTELIRTRALDIIGRHNGSEPMFLWLSFSAPHTPHQAPQEYVDLYPHVPEPRKTYLAMVTHMDEAIGAVVDALKESELWDNTLLIFSSDNGGEDGGYADNTPYRGSKGSLFEGGNKVVSLVSGPMLTRSGYRHEGLIHQTDWLPTLLSLAGISDNNVVVDGYDQSAMILHGAPSLRNHVIYRIDLEPHAYMGNAAIRVEDLKLIWGHPGYSDGYGLKTMKYWNNDFYINLIDNNRYKESNQSLDDVCLSVFGKQQVIPEIIGIDGMSRNHTKRGLMMLFNITNDPMEKIDLSDNYLYTSAICDLKMRLLQEMDDYVTPHAHIWTSRLSESDPGRYPYRAWSPGWCDDLIQVT